jgi:hypothetical protein
MRQKVHWLDKSNIKPPKDGREYGVFCLNWVFFVVHAYYCFLLLHATYPFRTPTVALGSFESLGLGLVVFAGIYYIYTMHAERSLQQMRRRFALAFVLFLLACLSGSFHILLLTILFGTVILTLFLSRDTGQTMSQVAQDNTASLLRFVFTPSVVSSLAQSLKDTIYWFIAGALAVLMRSVRSTGTVIPVIIPTRPGHGKAVSPRAP